MKTNRLLILSGVIMLAMMLGFSPLTSPVQAAGEKSGQQMQSDQSSQMSGQMSGQSSGQSSDQMAQNDAPIYISPMALQKIQEQLSQQGHDPGQTDGIWGENTSSAVKKFQEAKGFVPTGTLNVETIQALSPDILQGGSGQQAMASGGSGGQDRQKSAGPGAIVYISPQAVRHVQQSLKDNGFEISQVDGIWGTNTRDAVRKWQRDNDLEPSGHITVGLLDTLGLSREVASLGLGMGGQNQMDQMAQAQTQDQARQQGQQQGEMAQSGQQDQQQSGQQGRQPGEMAQTGQQDQTGQQEREARGYFGAQEKQPGGLQSQGSGAPLYAGTELIRQVQQALSQAGHDPGQTDGTWGTSTEKALGQFQYSNNLEPTGTLNLATLHRLVGEGGSGSGSGFGGSGGSGQPQQQ